VEGASEKEGTPDGARDPEFDKELGAGLDTPFVPCVKIHGNPKRTEMILRDTATVWVQGVALVDLGYDMETGELVCVRIYADVAKREK
jgi:hypothetical protein